MKMVSRIFDLIPASNVYAHCDIPCKIYDPHSAQVAAHTVIRMTQMLLDADGMEKGISKKHHISRLTNVKEEQAEIVKHEIRIIWGDYFKDEHIEKVPNIHELVHDIMLSASKCKQEINLDEAENLLSLVQDFSEAFYKTKGMEIVRVPSGFLTEGEIVFHK